MDFIKGKPKNQYFREYYEKRKPKIYCPYCHTYYGLKFKHINSHQHKINLSIQLDININLL